MIRRGILIFLAGALAVTAQTQNPNWDALVDRFFDQADFRFNPSAGTSAGFHQYDGKLEDFSVDAIRQEVTVLHQFESEVRDFPAARLTPEQNADRDIVLGNIRSSLLDLETIRVWEKNPDHYSSTATNAVFVIMSRKFAPEAERLKSVIARERQMPKMFEAARVNLKNPPRIYTEVAIEQLPGIVSFFQNDVPLAFRNVKDPALVNEFRAANSAVIREIERYELFLKNDLLPRSKGDFEIGADTYRKKLLYDEMVDIPLDRLLGIGYANLKQNQEAFRETAKKIDPKRMPQQILAAAEKDHPTAANLLNAFRDTLGGLRDYIVKHGIVTIPSPVAPIVEETPPFMRALTSASMDTPGPYETVAKEAFFNVTLPEKSWTPAHIEEHLEMFNRGVITSTSIHETYPGHYVQFLWVQSAPSKVRKLLGANSNAEGWAHYCEQMMIDEGYGGGDLKLRLGQLQDALLRDARYIVGIRMHTGQMTYDQAVDFFEKEGMQTHSTAVVETKRGTSDPTYLYYTLGKLEILKLREDYRKLRGTSFSLRDFHDTFLKQGFPPIRIVRRAMLGNDSPVL
ncbi:MAG TPA: DUF885 domain-containing protein [Bryobacteraceae bacterium]|jgi:uncharacterized protein (DUF885 family)|nr:DUF885 domain-containing protein [Bryobacteraceae bacterium]